MREPSDRRPGGGFYYNSLSLSLSVSATDPARMSARKTGSHAKAFKLNPEGKLMISEETGEGGEGGEAMDTSDTEVLCCRNHFGGITHTHVLLLPQVNRKRSRKDLNEDGDLTSGVYILHTATTIYIHV